MQTVLCLSQDDVKKVSLSMKDIVDIVESSFPSEKGDFNRGRLERVSK